MRLPRTDDGSIPARSNTSHDTSSSNRCCGSIASASRGEIPKNPASNSAAPTRNPPSRTYDGVAASQPRSSGNAEIPSRPSETSSHSCSGDDTPPGKRHAIPTIATGSPSWRGAAWTAASTLLVPVSSSWMCSASARAVG
ncbi:hypothetical protein LUX57_51510 [Actinomadura madurae]|nr:hypothetical protein [Actinomadura madurae]MCP9972490.1 hypothetical protein [Actinomadura madurae]